MILPVMLPRLGEAMRSATIHRLLACPGDALRPGTPLLELRVDLGAGQAQDCPPVIHLRIVATERGHLRAWSAAAGDLLEVGARIGLATSSPDEPVDGAPARALRSTAVVIQIDPLAA